MRSEEESFGIKKIKLNISWVWKLAFILFCFVLLYKWIAKTEVEHDEQVRLWCSENVCEGDAIRGLTFPDFFIDEIWCYCEHGNEPIVLTYERGHMPI